MKMAVDCRKETQQAYGEPRKTYCAGIFCTCEPRFARALLRVSAQYLRRSPRFFEVPYGDASCGDEKLKSEGEQ